MPGKSKAVRNGRALCDAYARVLGKQPNIQVTREVLVGIRPGGIPDQKRGRHRVDLVITRSTDRKRVAVSVKSQTSSGTVDEKIPWEVLSLKKLLAEHPDFVGALVVTDGSGAREWIRDYFEGAQFRSDMAIPKNLRIVGDEEFRSLVQEGRLF